MPLQQGEVQSYDFNRSVVEFTMLNQGNVILCAISTAAMDDLEGRRDVRPDQRVDQFMRLREVIEEREPIRVGRCRLQRGVACPPHFQQRTCAVHWTMSAMGQKRTFAPTALGRT